MTSTRPRMVFVSPIFLFPRDSGGKIRTSNILRGLRGGRFHVTLMAPASDEQLRRWRDDIDSVCDEFKPWRPTAARPRWRRGFDLFGSVPVNVASDRTEAAVAAVQAAARDSGADLMVFDFVHASILRPEELRCRSVCFTHNVEAEIFARHAAQARDPARRWLWSSQHAKMVHFERTSLRRFDKVIAVSERDAQHFRSFYGVADAEAIPTGVDLDHFAYQPPPPKGPDGAPTVVFTGSMDSAANIDGVSFFLTSIWPLVVKAMPQARFVVIGRHPPASLVALGRRYPNVEFTGFVDDVRPHVYRGQVSVIPLQVGGGTRIKAFEAMAMGSPVVSTSVGIEGLDVQPDEHYLNSDTPEGFAGQVLQLLRDERLREALSRRARALVESRFGHRVAAQVFEGICLRTLDAAG